MGNEFNDTLAIARPSVDPRLTAGQEHLAHSRLLRLELAPFALQFEPQHVRRPDRQQIREALGDAAIDLVVAVRTYDHVWRNMHPPPAERRECLFHLFLPLAFLERAVHQSAELTSVERRLH